MMMKDDTMNNGKMPIKQYFQWGTVKWLPEPDDVSKGKLLVGHITFLPKAEQKKHLHTGDEQILYTLSGKGVHWIDGKEYPLSYGKVYHIPPYGEHAVKNLRDEPLEMIIVYNANSLSYKEMLPPAEFSTRYAIDNLKGIIDLSMLQKVQDKFSEASQIAILIRDEKGEIITKPSNLSPFCQHHCSYNNRCYLKSKKAPHMEDETKVFNCCLDLVTLYTPIYMGDTYIGSISCGPVFLNEPSQRTLEVLEKEGNRRPLKDYLNIRRLTKARLYAIMESLMTMSRFIVETGINNLAQRELHQRTIQMLEDQQKKIELEKALQETKMEALQAQLSPHFLFNTLSVIGELAYMQGAKDAAETTFALSNLLRTTLKKSEEMTKVWEELDYIKDYLFIQKKRFHQLVEIKIDVEENVMEVEIPFMTLQLLVENTIVHGLEANGKPITIQIKGKRKDDYIFLEVMDNGCGMKKEVIETLFEKTVGIKEGTGIGLANLKERFRYYYDEDFQLKICSQWGEGTQVFIKIPVHGKEKGGKE
ncbi:PocR ligand-binding domain-containing protein [Natronincola ferrireducens]|uniref:histidine kinase n=1 Tax=Natronincola ferrireducens TaxID=393762 RepID=A0A1G8XR96_9FIRM|nr:PocR ligand-binding domain-containing protein [Natronincola ferrireducens]SDJ92300.1 Histidine kinase-, DNA gyrase B-, and HSP90-like ATPase [Natronincola ferrireducens]